MAAICQLEHAETGEKVWRYSVDAKEILGAPGSKYKLTGNVKRSGWATPSGPRSRISAQVARTRSVGAEVAKAVTEALVAAGVVGAPQASAGDTARAVTQALVEAGVVGAPQGASAIEAALAASDAEAAPGEPTVEVPKGFEDGLPPDPDEDPEPESTEAPDPLS